MKILLTGLLLLITSVAYGQGPGPQPKPILTVQEQDGSPIINNVKVIKVTNGTLTDNGGGTVSLITGGGGGGGTPGGSNTQLQFNSVGSFGGITGATTDGTTVTMASPVATTALTTTSATFALLNTTATTVNAFGAATLLNMAGGSGAVINLGGGANAAELRFLEPSGSGSNYSGFKAQAQAGNVTYTLPAADAAVSGYVLSSNGSGTLSWIAGTGVPGGSNTQVQFNDSSAFGGNAGLVFDKATGNLTATGNVTGAAFLGSGSGAGYVELPQGTAPSLGTTSVQIVAPASVTSYKIIMPGAAATGLLHLSNSSNTVTASISGVAVADLTASGTPSSTTFLRGDNTWATPIGAGTVTVVSSGSLTSTAIVTGGGTTTLQTPSATSTLDSSGNMILAGTLTAGNSGTGEADFPEGTAPSGIASTDVLFADSTAHRLKMINNNGTAVNVIGTTDVPYDLFLMFDSTPAASAVYRMVAVRAFDSGTNWAGTKCSAAVAANAQTDFVLAVNGTTKATLRFAASGTTCSIVSGTTTAISSGDVITVTAPASPDANLSSIAITLLGVLH